MSTNNNLPLIADLYKDVSLMQSTDKLTALLNQQPDASWVKIHPYIANYKYLPIDKVEYLLKRIFKKYRIEVLREGTAFNGVYVVVRVHYLNPVSNEWDYHDGVGAKELQVKKGTSPADLSNINNGALAMAFPIAKTVALKDACDHFGTLFGADLNRKDVMQILTDDNLQSKSIIDDINSKVEQPVKTAPVPVSDAAPAPETGYQAFEEIPAENIEVIQDEVLGSGAIPEPAPVAPSAPSAPGEPEPFTDF